MIQKTDACRLCSHPLSQTPAFSIVGAARSVNDLPPAGFIGQDNVTLHLMRCEYCGHFQLGNAPVDTWQHAITAAGLSNEMRAFRLRQFAEFKQRFSLNDNMTIWEIGSGEGLFLDLLKEVGFAPVGLEASETLVTRGCKQGRNLVSGHPQSGSLTGRQIDAFITINFLEHATQPVDFLRQLRSACTPNAVGLIEVPDFTKDLKLNRSHDLVAEHLSYFTEDTLKLALRLAGFEVLETLSVWGGDDIVAYVRALPAIDLANWDNRDPALVALKEYCSNPAHTPLAVWGASHQALTLLAMSGGRHGIIAIADSSPRKQGRQDPAWGIPIVSPDEMLALKPAAVLIMAAGYSTEVARQLREKGFHGHAAILADGALNTIPDP